MNLFMQKKVKSRGYSCYTDEKKKNTKFFLFLKNDRQQIWVTAQNPCDTVKKKKTKKTKKTLSQEFFL